ncbi:MAG: START domain-containing protein [Bacteroidota bacterium]
MYKVAALFLLLLGFLTASGQQNWKLNNEVDGIKVYSAAVPDSKVKAIKVECDLQATLAQLVTVLLDIKTCTDWVYNTKSCILLKQVSASELYYYSEVNIPWPAQNRDFVAHLTITQNPDTKVVYVDGPAVPGMVPIKKGVVRIERSIGKWVIAPLAGGRVHVTYTLQVDPGGIIPAWLVNMVAGEGPTQSFKKLRLQLQKPAYRDVSLSFIKD